MYQLFRIGRSDNWSVNRESCFVFSGGRREVEDWLDAQENAGRRSASGPGALRRSGMLVLRAMLVLVTIRPLRRALTRTRASS